MRSAARFGLAVEAMEFAPAAAGVAALVLHKAECSVCRTTTPECLPPITNHAGKTITICTRCIADILTLLLESLKRQSPSSRP